MSSLKRKDAPGVQPSPKRGKTGAASTPTKQPSKPAKSAKNTDTKSPKDARPPKSQDNVSAKTATQPAVSRLKEEEPLFPRGGGSILSPFEQKQISVQAKQDVLFEQESSVGVKKAGNAGKKGKKAGKDTKAGKKSNSAADGEAGIRIESLNYKRLVKGSLVLAQVTDITPLELTLALPNNLSGTVPITGISDTLNDRIAAEAEGDDNDDEAQEAEGDSVDLKSMFRIGQYVRAYVTSTVEEATATSNKPRKHILLSLRPEHTNTGLSSSDVVTNTTVMATVMSAEDHGYVMELGLDDSSLRGFLPRKELDSGIAEARMQPGNVLLCLVTKIANGKVAQLTTAASKIGKVQNHASTATTINAFLPGSAVEILVDDIAVRGIAGKVMGSLDVTCDLLHSGLGPQGVDLESKFKIGKKIKARIICNFPTAKEPKLGISLLDHVMTLQPLTTTSKKAPTEILPLSSKIEKCTVTKVENEIGLFVDIGVPGISGFVHVSRVKDGKVDMLSATTGPFKVGSEHQGRVVGYNALDGLFQLSFEKTVLEQPFLRIEDVPVGDVVHGEIEKLSISQEGVSGLLVKLAEGVSGFVPEAHMSDVRLQHPEKKFHPGLKVKARVLSTDSVKRQVRLTLKKTLVNSEAPVLKSFDDVIVGMQTPGTIISVLQKGAIVQFYGGLKGFLPVSEMSEAYIRDPKEHFRVGQVVNIHVLNFDADANKLIVSCKDPSAFGLDKQKALKDLSIGEIVTAKVVQKTEDDVFVEIGAAGLKAILSVHHLADRPGKGRSALKTIRVGQTLSELVVLEKNEGRRFIAVSKKPSLLKASKDGAVIKSLEDAKPGIIRQGFVKNITVTAVFVQFFGQTVALVPKSKIASEDQKKTDFGLEKHQAIEVVISSVDKDLGRIFAAPAALIESDAQTATKKADTSPASKAENPVDSSVSTMDDIFVGQVVKARIASIKSTQLNMRLADNIQGRVDVSQVFDSWKDIVNPKSPLSTFKIDQVIEVRILGVHDARNHRFLPISHRSSHMVFELSAKPSDVSGAQSAVLSMSDLKVDSEHLAFVNNVQQRALWVSLSPNVRGRISFTEISDDVAQLENLSSSFPLGSALRARVLAVNPSEGHLDLTTRSANSSPSLTWDTIKQNMVLPGRVTKVNERQVMVQLSETVSGPVYLADLGDDFEEANTTTITKNSIVRVSVVSIDKSNKKIRLSSRPSRVLNSALPVKDREILSATQISTGDIIRGFVKNVADKGLFVGLGGDVTAMVRISDLSDKFLKEWKDHFQVDQLVKGRITSVDPATGYILMSLKDSAVDQNFKPLINFHELREGQVVTGTVRKVEAFGAFILVDGSANISGLCHRSEMAEKPVEDATKLFAEGDTVKAIVLKLDKQKKRINFGLKPSYFEDEDSEMSDDDDEEAGAALLGSDVEGEDDDEDEDEDSDSDDDLVKFVGLDVDDSDSGEEDEDVEMSNGQAKTVEALDAGGFDWSGNALDDVDMEDANAGDDAASAQDKKKKKKRKAQIEVDKSGDLAAFGPRTAVDYEQLLNRQPNSSALWIEYMALQMQVSEIAKAREVAERAVKTINSAEETEKLNAWIAYLNLEVRFGTAESVEEVFNRAGQVNDQQEVYQRLASIYIQEEKTRYVPHPQTRIHQCSANQMANNPSESRRALPGPGQEVWRQFARRLDQLRALAALCLR
ncbi:rRNA biogenesis protein RRP5 [Microdochium nivale]|nr:rRNA biogenesis protein RRP5 [Microdochium nivale]